MGTVNCFEEWFARNLDRIKTNILGGEELASEFGSAATNLARRDQAERLRNLKSRVLAEVKGLLDMESSANLGFSKGKLVSAHLSFVAGGFIGMLLHHDHPIATALKATEATLRQNSPFGTVLVAIGEGGLPDNVKVISLSRMARESGMSELEVKATLASKGYFLTTQQIFTATMDVIERRVLDGVSSLPLPVTEFQKRMP